jgi:cysteinyl-tRNA synthetase
MDWTAEKARAAEATLRKWRTVTERVVPGNPSKVVVDALSNDLNMPEALSELHRMARMIARQEPASNEPVDLLAGLLSGFLASAQLLGLLLPEMGEWAAAPEADLSGLADKLATLRANALETKDFAPVDAMKQALIAAGVEVRMSKAGVELLPGPDFDSAKLEGL